MSWSAKESSNPLETALSALRRHLNIQEEPALALCFLAKERSPQMEVGCGFADKFAVEGCIQKAMNLISEEKVL